MKRITALFIVLLSAVSAFCLSGCVMISSTYNNSDRYSAGDREFDGGKVRSLDIEWESGSIEIIRHDADTVTITEGCKSDLKEEQQVHSWLDGNVLRIRFCRSGEPFFFKMSEKKLEIKIPRDMVLDDLSCTSSSGDMLFKEISAETINANASSGDMTIEQKGESSSIKAATSSGEIDITAEKTASVETAASSGDITLRLESMPDDVTAATSSGNIKVCVPEDAGFTVKAATASGDFDSDLTLTKEGSRYVYGNGKCEMELAASSGDICITYR